MTRDNLPFKLPERPRVTRIRQRDARELRHPPGERTQPLAGFEPRFPDIVDYIVRITDEIWVDRAIGYIYDTYDPSCTIYSSYGVVRSVEEVVASTVTTLNAFPDGEAHHLNVAWSGDDVEGFYTSHLGFSRSTNLGTSQFGPATGRRVGIRFVADCVSRENRIHTEWLVRDNGALVRQLGLDLHEVARRIADTPGMERPVLSPPTRMDGQAPRAWHDDPSDTLEGWVAYHFQNIWNMRLLDRLPDHYWPEAVVHSGGGRVAQGVRSIGALMLSILAAIPDGVVRPQHVCWSDETDGVIVAVRWVLEGSTRPGGALGDVPAGRPVAMLGASHFRFAGAKVIEEWTVFDEVGVLAQAYRGQE